MAPALPRGAALHDLLLFAYDTDVNRIHPRHPAPPALLHDSIPLPGPSTAANVLNHFLLCVFLGRCPRCAE